MKASQTVFITADRTKAVPEGDKDAKFLLAREGQEVPAAVAEKYDGAEKLLSGKSTTKGDAPKPQNRDDETAGKLHKRDK